MKTDTSTLRSPGRRKALQSITGISLAMPVSAPFIGGFALFPNSPVLAANNVGVRPNQGDLAFIPLGEAPSQMMAEWQTGNYDTGPFKTASSADAYAKAPPGASRYLARTYTFPTGTFRTLTFPKGRPVFHLVTFETEIYVLSGSAELVPFKGMAGAPRVVRAGDVLFLPNGYFSSATASEDFIILAAYVGRTVREAPKSIVEQKAAVVSNIAEWTDNKRQIQRIGTEGLRQAPQGAYRASVRRYPSEGNEVVQFTINGGRSNSSRREDCDRIVYVVKGRVRRREGDRSYMMSAGDCVREIKGNTGYWEPLEETVMVATNAPFNPAMLPPRNT